MPAPSKNFTVVADSAIDADSPLTADLMEDLRDNDIHLEEWLGKDYTAATNHDHDGTNSATVRGNPGTHIDSAAEEATEFTHAATSYATHVTQKIYIPVAGTFTIYASYRIKTSAGGGDGVMARCYIDSATAVAETAETTAGNYAYVTASGSTGALTAGWHTIELQTKRVNNGAGETVFLQGYHLAVR